ncbi:hypothetical protein F5J12DRAFT_784825 [Pisolithus orientalis]|uniref:uncharacterized protein n=1 Tax=Pisolithus orientalis TaxID=936130 RepID=UPI00222488C3|nr:uncharacterized protein F5J12DRAFT_784825 [Pisolithus orientalis]KAI5998984.1 hypothetical protein F5J12DRAFT_784825 [Pisolithus orientalis]
MPKDVDAKTSGASIKNVYLMREDKNRLYAWQRLRHLGQLQTDQLWKRNGAELFMLVVESYVFPMCLERVNVASENDWVALVIRVFWQLPLSAIPVWICLAKRYVRHKQLRPKAVHDNEVVDESANDYTYFACIKFINSVFLTSVSDKSCVSPMALSYVRRRLSYMTKYESERTSELYHEGTCSERKLDDSYICKMLGQYLA